MTFRGSPGICSIDLWFDNTTACGVFLAALEVEFRPAGTLHMRDVTVNSECDVGKLQAGTPPVPASLFYTRGLPASNAAGPCPYFADIITPNLAFQAARIRVLGIPARSCRRRHP